MITIQTDSRGRTTLGAKDATYVVTDLGGGTLLLEPAQVLTNAEVAVLGNPVLLDQVRRASTTPEPGVPRRRRDRSPRPDAPRSDASPSASSPSGGTSSTESTRSRRDTSR